MGELWRGTLPQAFSGFESLFGQQEKKQAVKVVVTLEDVYAGAPKTIKIPGDNDPETIMIPKAAKQM